MNTVAAKPPARVVGSLTPRSRLTTNAVAGVASLLVAALATLSVLTQTVLGAYAALAVVALIAAWKNGDDTRLSVRLGAPLAVLLLGLAAAYFIAMVVLSLQALLQAPTAG